jgi:hypothetical protein
MRFSAVFAVISVAFAATSAALVEKRQTGYAGSYLSSHASLA